MIVVADACPIVFLAKLDRLALVQAVFPGTVMIPETVRDELVRETIPAHERQRIGAFLKHCRVEAVENPRVGASALSLADCHVLALARKHPKARLVSDDGLVRRIALAEGLTVTGTLGLIIRAARAGIMTRSEALHAVDALVRDHQLRISVDLYQDAVRQLQ
jgi:uncharacterized protein